MLQCKQVWHWMQLCVRLPNNWNESGHQSLVRGSVPSIKAVTVSQFPRGVSTPAHGAPHLSTATMSTWIWMRAKLQWFILYILLATRYSLLYSQYSWQLTKDRKNCNVTKQNLFKFRSLCRHRCVWWNTCNASASKLNTKTVISTFK